MRAHMFGSGLRPRGWLLSFGRGRPHTRSEPRGDQNVGCGRRSPSRARCPRTRTSTRSASTPSARWRWTRCRRRSPGHPGTPMALAPVAYTLWQDVPALRPGRSDLAEPRPLRALAPATPRCCSTRCCTSPASRRSARTEPLDEPAVSLDDIKQFRQLEQRDARAIRNTATPPASRPRPGRSARASATSVGMAMAQRLARPAATTGPASTLFDYRVYAICGDGDMMEGVSSEAASLAGHLKLSNLCWIYDNNHITIEGAHQPRLQRGRGAPGSRPTAGTCCTCDDANDTAALIARAARGREGDQDRPTLIIVRQHHRLRRAEQAGHRARRTASRSATRRSRLAKRFYGWPEDAQFLVPGRRATSTSPSGIGARRRRLRAAWKEMLARYQQASIPDLAARARTDGAARAAGRAGTRTSRRFPADAKGIATRDSSGQGAECDRQARAVADRRRRPTSRRRPRRS